MTPKALSPAVYWVLIGLVIVFFALLRFRLRGMPLERDEGEYAYAGQLILQGIPPYQLVYNMKLPGTYAAYSLIMAVFGQSATGIHLGLIVVNAITVVLVFLLGRRLFGPLAGLTAGAAYALLSTSESVLGFAAHATHFVVLAAVAGILVLLEAVSSKRDLHYFLSGLLLGVAFVMKQPGIFLAIFGGLYLIASERLASGWRVLFRRFAMYCVGTLLPFALTCLIVLKAGVLGKMWFWTFSYARQYATRLTLAEGWQIFRVAFPLVVGPFLPVWILAAVGLTAFAWNSRIRPQSTFTIGFLIFSALAVGPGLYFRSHYFILMLPSLAVLAGAAVGSLRQVLQQHHATQALTPLPAMPVAVMVLLCLWSQEQFLFEVDPDLAGHYVYSNNPFPEALKVAAYIKEHTAPDARIAVIGSEPEIYFYARRHSATGYIYTYPLMENQAYARRMQDEMTRQIEDGRPEYVVFVNVRFSWLPQPNSDLSILQWAAKYLEKNYELVGIADILDPETQYVWDDAVKGYHIRSDASLEVFKRR